MDKEILNMEEAAELFNVSIKTFIKLLKEEKVPARKIGREWRFSRQALIQWLSAGDSQQYSSSESDPKEFFDRVAAEWSKLRSGYYDEDVINILQSSGLLEKDMVLVDLGAGDGYLARAVAPSVDTVIAVDISGAMISELRKKAAAERIRNIQTIVSDGCDVPLEDGSVDLVCANMFLHHIEEPISAVREMGRILKPGGKVFLADLVEHGNKELMEAMHDVWPGFSRKDISDWFLRCGFSIRQFDTLGQKTSGRKAGKKKGGSVFVMTAVKQ